MNPFLDMLSVSDPNLNPDFLVKSSEALNPENGGENFDLLLAQNMSVESGMIINADILNKAMVQDTENILNPESIQLSAGQLPTIENALGSNAETVEIDNILLSKEQADLLISGNEIKAQSESGILKTDDNMFAKPIVTDSLNSLENNEKITGILDKQETVNLKVLLVDNRMLNSIAEDEIAPENEKVEIDTKFKKLSNHLNLKRIELNSEPEKVNIPSLNPVKESNIRLKVGTNPANAVNPSQMSAMSDSNTDNKMAMNYNSIEEQVLMDAAKEAKSNSLGDKSNMADKIFDKILESAPNDIGSVNNKTGLVSIQQIERDLIAKEDMKIQPVRFVLPENLKINNPNGKQTISIKLVPEQLGNVRLTLSSQNNAISGKMIVESPSALVSVESNINSLIDELSQKGIKVDSFDISLAGDQLDNNFAQSHNSESMKHNNQRFANDGIYESDLAEDTPMTASRNYIGTGRVNLVA